MSTLVLDTDRLTPEQVAWMASRVRDAMRRDRAHEAYPLWEDVSAYLRARHNKTYAERSYEEAASTLVRLVRYFPDLRVEDFEPPVGTERIEEWLEHFWGGLAPGTYTKNLRLVREFFKWHRIRGRLHGDPTLVIDPARKREPHREVFSDDDCRALIAAANLRDRIALRLLLDYGRRKGELRAVRFRHFDYQRKRVTTFGKGSKVHNVPIPQPAFWTDLERHMLEAGAKGDHFLMAGSIRGKGIWIPDPTRPMSNHKTHDWFVDRCADAGIEHRKMHTARHTAGQRVLDKTGNIKAVQKLLGHKSGQTTMDTYTDWDERALAATMALVLEDS